MQRHRVIHRLHALEVETGHVLGMVEDRGQLPREPLELLGTQLEPGQSRDVSHISGRDPFRHDDGAYWGRYPPRR